MFCDPQARLAELDTPRRLENLQKLDELKKHLMDLEKQVKKISIRSIKFSPPKNRLENFFQDIFFFKRETLKFVKIEYDRWRVEWRFNELKRNEIYFDVGSIIPSIER